MYKMYKISTEIEKAVKKITWPLKVKIGKLFSAQLRDISHWSRSQSYINIIDTKYYLFHLGLVPSLSSCEWQWLGFSKRPLLSSESQNLRSLDSPIVAINRRWLDRGDGHSGQQGTGETPIPEVFSTCSPSPFPWQKCQLDFGTSFSAHTSSMGLLNPDRLHSCPQWEKLVKIKRFSLIPLQYTFWKKVPGNFSNNTLLKQKRVNLPQFHTW